MELLFESRTNLSGFAGNIVFFQRRPAIHAEPVLVPDCPADAKGVSIYGSVHRDGGKLRMWYHTFPDTYNLELNAMTVAYAESDDGIHWTKPALGIVEHDGKPNNLTNLGLHSASVFIDPQSPASHRYRAVGSGSKIWFMSHVQPEVEHRGYYTAHSADGLRWTLDAPNPRWPSADVVNSIYHPGRQCGIVAMKYTPRVGRLNRRSIHTAEFRNGEYSDAVSALYPDEFDDIVATTRGYHSADYYGMGMMPAGNNGVVGFLWNYWHQLPYMPSWTSAIFGVSDVSLVYQNEPGGKWFHIPGRPMFIDRTMTPWPNGWINTASNVIDVGDEHRLYFSGWSYSHAFGLGKDLKRVPQWAEYREKYPGAGITFASWPKWQLFGFEADPEATFKISLGPITKPSKILLNYEITRPEGNIRTELKADGVVIRPLAESVPLTGSSTGKALAWTSGTVVPPTAGAQVTLYLQCARVYAYEVQPLET